MRKLEKIEKYLIYSIKMEYGYNSLEAYDIQWLIDRIKKLEKSLKDIESTIGHVDLCKPKNYFDCYAGCEAAHTAHKALEEE